MTVRPWLFIVRTLAKFSGRRPMSDPVSAKAVLLLDRMKSVGLSSSAVEQSDPAVMLNLRRECSLCALKSQCSRDLASAETVKAVAGYCPNEPALKSLLGS